MGFKDNIRLEQIYFANLKRNITTLKAWKDREADVKTLDVINSCIEADEAILLLYKNLGEEWNELTAYIAEEKAHLEELKAEFETFKGEINEKIDDVNNYLVGRVSALEDRVAELENFLTLTTRVRLIYTDEINEDNTLADLLNWEDDQPITYEELNSLCNTNWVIILMDYTQDPPAYAYLDKWEDGAIYLTRIEVTHGYDNVSRTYYVSSIIKHVYTILEDEMRYDRYEEDIHGLEERFTDLATREMIYKNLVAIKQPSNYYHIFTIEDMETPLDCEALCNLAMNGVDLRVVIHEDTTYTHSEDYLTVNLLNMTHDGQGAITDGLIMFSVVSYNPHGNNLYWKSLSAEYSDQADFRLDSGTV